MPTDAPLTTSDVAETVDADLPCAGCGYNLRSARGDGVCTECGLAVARSLGRDNPLWESRPAWLRSLSCGVWMMIAAQALLIVSILGAPALEPIYDDPRVVLCGLLALYVLHASGTWILTRRERLFMRPSASNRFIRTVARVGVLGPLGAVAVMAVSIANRGFNNPPTGALVAMIALLSLVVPGMLATYLYLRTLARRVLSRRMGEYATIVAFGGAASTLLFLAWIVAAALDYNLDITHDAWFVALVLLFTAVCLFYLWSLLVLILFAVAFARASRAARVLWNERSAV